MITKYAAAALLSAALMTGVASAQTNSAAEHNAKNAMHHAGDWRASKLVGVNVYNDANEKIGDINEVILDHSGKVANVILGVGGFLGMGEHYVAVSFDKLKWVDVPVRSTTSDNRPVTTTTKDGTSTTTTTGASTTPTSSTKDNWYPDHAVYNATKDQLKAMPQFKY